MELQAASKFGRMPAEVLAYTAYGIAYGVRALMGKTAATSFGSTLASAAGGAMMNAAPFFFGATDLCRDFPPARLRIRANIFQLVKIALDEL